MSLSDIFLSPEDFKVADWEEAIDQCDLKECQSYSGRFFDLAKEVQDTSGPTQDVYRFLGHVTSPMLRSENDKEPFQPLVVLGDSRSTIPSDFTELQLVSLDSLAPNIEDSELKARVADILWVIKKKHKMARLAVDAYLESAKRLEDPLKWPLAFSRVQRANCISLQLGKNNDYVEKVVSYIETLLARYKAEDPLYLCAELIGLLQRKRLGDFEKYAVLSEELASSDEQSRLWPRARKYWELSYGWHKLLKDTDAQSRVRIRLMETFVSEAEDAASLIPPQYAVAVQCIQNAIEECRRVGQMGVRVEELHKQLLKYQSLSVSQLKTSSFETDVSSVVELITSAIKGKTFENAILQLAAIGDSIAVSDLRSQVEKGVSDYPLQFLIGQVLHSSTGKVIARRPSILSGEVGASEKAIQSSMLSYSRFLRHFHSISVIDVGRQQINQEHEVSVESFSFIVDNSEFIPPGREAIYARGLLEGLKGDFLVSTHLLIPQIEHSIRYLMQRRGHIVSGLDRQGIQDEHNVNTLLYRSELIEILGEDIVFDMRGLLVERFGNNLRNNMAHGLIDAEGFRASENSSLWWLTLRLCVLLLPSSASEAL